MVYCGKPSKGCDYCRKKRLKCDQKNLPGCGQCRNASRVCPGYRNQLDLLFRDESSRVKQKYRVASGKDADSDAERASNCSEHDSSASHSPRELVVGRKRSPKAARGDRSSPDSRSGQASDVECLLPALSQTLSDIAVSFFMTTYIPGSNYDYLPVYCSTASPDSLLVNVVQAVALASLSHETRQPDLMALARQQYSRSLVEMNRAIQDFVACRDDETLASVLLLAHFETLASEDSTQPLGIDSTLEEVTYSPSPSWERHVQGAVSLLELREQYLLDSPTSLKLYQHVNATARYSCVQRRVRLPAQLSSWGQIFGFKRDLSDPKRRFMVVADDFTELRACIEERSTTDPLEIIQQAKSIDESAALASRCNSPSWVFDVVTCTRSIDGVYRNKYHLYSSHSVAQFWNEVRMTRLALNEIILAYAKIAQQRSSPPNEDEEDDDEIFSLLRARCIRTIEQMATEICQSTTEFLRKPGSSPGLGAGTSTLHHSIASAFFLIWPLHTAARAARFGTTALGEFVVERLHFIAREMSIPQARRAAVMLERGVVEEDWLHMLHLF